MYFLEAATPSRRLERDAHIIELFLHIFLLVCVRQPRLLATTASIVNIARLELSFLLVVWLLLGGHLVNWRFNRRKNNFVFLREPVRGVSCCVLGEARLLALRAVGGLARSLLGADVEARVLVVEIVAVG